MNFSFQVPTIFGSSEEAALYFNSMVVPHDLHFYEPQLLVPSYYPMDLTYAFYSPYAATAKADPQAERPTDEFECLSGQPAEGRPKLEVREERNGENELAEKEGEAEEWAEAGGRGAGVGGVSIVRREKNLKKNTESNLINNVYSYICSELKSHRMVHSLLKTPSKIKIFYIFAKNLKKLNSKYLNRRNLQNICEILPHESHFKMLAKSVKRLAQLPLPELRTVLRRLILNYLRGEVSLLPLLTSKKISKVAMLEHLQKRRELQTFLTDCVTASIGEEVKGRGGV